jgi:hypothetical protein
MTDYVQLRIVAPLAFDRITVLPRLTFRHFELPAGHTRLGNSDLFALLIPKGWDWGTGRVGLGPLITAPGNKNVAKDEWATDLQLLLLMRKEHGSTGFC